MEPDAVQGTTPALSEYQTPSANANWSTLPPSLTSERGDKSEQTSELPRKDRRASSSPRRKAQSTQPTDRSRVCSKSKSSTPKGTRGRLRWNEPDDSVTEAIGSSTDDEQKCLPPSRAERAVDAPYRIVYCSLHYMLRAHLPPHLRAASTSMRSRNTF